LHLIDCLALGWFASLHPTFCQVFPHMFILMLTPILLCLLACLILSWPGFP
jgi:hypothetical protein